MFWLLENSVRESVERAYLAGVFPTIDQQQEFEGRFSADESGRSRILTIAGNNAEISIHGVITKTPNLMAMLFGGGNTTWGEIVSAIAEAEADDSVDNITFAIDSPGGSVDGMFDAMDAVQAASKPTKSVISNMGASAAYSFATQSDSIEASNRAARIGSVGVMTKIKLDGEDEVTLTSSAAPNKHPDASTPAGKAVIVAQLDDMHKLLVEAIAKGRNTTIENVNAEFGQGGVFLAEEANNRGMIDGVAGLASLRVVKKEAKITAKPGGERVEAKSMTIQELQAQEPDLYAEVLALGVSHEKDRVVAHLTLGAASGSMDTAIEAINDGSALNATVQAKYMAAGINRVDVAAAGGDDAAAAAALAAAADTPEAQAAAAEESVVAKVEIGLGVTGDK